MPLIGQYNISSVISVYSVQIPLPGKFRLIKQLNSHCKITARKLTKQEQSKQGFFQILEVESCAKDE